MDYTSEKIRPDTAALMIYKNEGVVKVELWGQTLNPLIPAPVSAGIRGLRGLSP